MADEPKQTTPGENVITSSTLGKRSLEDEPSGSNKRLPPPEHGAEGSDPKGKLKESSVVQGDEHAPKKKGFKKGGRKGEQSRKAYKSEPRDSRRGTRRETSVDGEPAVENDGQPKADRLPKRACAMLIGFCGEGYNGMQMLVSHLCGINHHSNSAIRFRQPNAKTIENTLFNALVKAGAVSQDNADDPVKVRRGVTSR